MDSNSRLIPWLLLAILFLAGCSAASVLSDQDPADNPPSAAEINAAAERAATEQTTRDPKVTPKVSLTESVGPEPSPVATREALEAPSPEEPPINRRVEVPDGLFVNWLIPWDGIRPIYDPEFVPASEAPLDDDELVIGIAWDDEAKAYPITVLRSREMVNDELAGIPVLVTW